MDRGYAFSALEEGPTRPRAPITEGQLEAVGKLGLSFGRSRRTEAINTSACTCRCRWAAGPMGNRTYLRREISACVACSLS